MGKSKQHNGNALSKPYEYTGRRTPSGTWHYDYEFSNSSEPAQSSHYARRDVYTGIAGGVIALIFMIAFLYAATFQRPIEMSLLAIGAGIIAFRSLRWGIRSRRSHSKSK